MSDRMMDKIDTAWSAIIDYSRDRIGRAEAARLMLAGGWPATHVETLLIAADRNLKITRH